MRGRERLLEGGGGSGGAAIESASLSLSLINPPGGPNRLPPSSFPLARPSRGPPLSFSLSLSFLSRDPPEDGNKPLLSRLLTCSPSLGALVVCEHEKPNFPSYLSIKCLMSVPLPTPLGPQTTSAAGGRCCEVEVAAFWSPSGEEAAAPIALATWSFFLEKRERAREKREKKTLIEFSSTQLIYIHLPRLLLTLRASPLRRLFFL